MYCFKHPFRRTKCLFWVIILIFIGCEEPVSPTVKLDSALITHFTLIQEGKTGSARVRIRQRIEEKGESAQPLFLMGLSYHKEKKYTKAADWFERAAKFDLPEDQYPPTWHFLGWSYYYLGEIEKSTRAFETFLSIQPNEGDSFFALGLLAMDSGDRIAAKEYYKKSIAFQQDNPKGQAKAMARLGDVLVVDNPNAAREMYLQSLSLDPDLYEAWYRLAKTYKQNDAELFQKYLQKSKEAKLRVTQKKHNTSFPE